MLFFWGTTLANYSLNAVVLIPSGRIGQANELQDCLALWGAAEIPGVLPTDALERTGIISRHLDEERDSI